MSEVEPTKADGPYIGKDGRQAFKADCPMCGVSFSIDNEDFFKDGFYNGASSRDAMVKETLDVVKVALERLEA